MKKSPTVFLGPLEISGFYGNLEAGFTEIGVESRLVLLHPHPHNYPQSRPNPLAARIAVRAVLHHRGAGIPGKLFWGALFLAASFCVLVWTLPRFNSYIFSWGESILPGNRDLPILRLLRKEVVVVLGHGSEARPAYMSTPPSGAPPFSATIVRRLHRETTHLARKVRRIERWASSTIGLPTTGQFFNRPFVNFYALGLPTARADSAQRAPKLEESKEIVVLHVPSKPEVKGSAYIRECMERVVAKNSRVRYVELAGRPHEEVLEAIQKSTFVIDQLWSDIPMAIVGTEAAMFGKPTVIAGYAWDEWHKRLLDEDWPPTIASSPDDLLAAIDECVADVDGMEALGKRAQEFVATRWSRSSVASNYLRVLVKDVPQLWLIDPSDVSYGFGCGVSKENVGRMVDALVSTFGPESLQWSRAPMVYGIERQ